MLRRQLRLKAQKRAAKAMEKKTVLQKKNNFITKTKTKKLKDQNKNKYFAPANKKPSLIFEEFPLRSLASFQKNNKGGLLQK